MSDRGRARSRGPDRRVFCAAAGAFALGLAARSPAAARTYLEDVERRVPIRNLWTEETRDLVYWRDGDYDRRALDAYSYLLRDRRGGEVEPIFYGLLDQLFFLWKALGRPGQIGLVSGYRSPGIQRMASHHDGGGCAQLAAHDRHGGGHQGGRHRDGCGLARGGRSAAGRRRPLSQLRLRPPRRGPRAELGFRGVRAAQAAKKRLKALRWGDDRRDQDMGNGRYVP